MATQILATKPRTTREWVLSVCRWLNDGLYLPFFILETLFLTKHNFKSGTPLQNHCVLSWITVFLHLRNAYKLTFTVSLYQCYKVYTEIALLFSGMEESFICDYNEALHEVLSSELANGGDNAVAAAIDILEKQQIQALTSSQGNNANTEIERQRLLYERHIKDLRYLTTFSHFSTISNKVKPRMYTFIIMCCRVMPANKYASIQEISYLNKKSKVESVFKNIRKNISHRVISF